MKSSKNIFILISMLLISNQISAHNNNDHHEKKGDPFIDMMIGQVSFMQQRITSLAEAIPEDKYSWRPEEGVRSTSEQIVHTLTAAYGIPSRMGADMPSHINQEVEKTMTEKEEILTNLNASFEAAKSFLKDYDTANYEKIVETPFGKFSQRTMILILNNHYHEHLGQLIVYARVNGIVPPWSEKKEH